MPGEIEPRDIKVGDAEREHVGQLLQRALGEGRITLDEFETRLTAAMAARTRGELNAQVLDIAEVVAPVPPKDVLVLRSGVGDIKRRGTWVVPATLKVSGGMGDVLLDFSQAQLTSPVTTIEAKLGVGDLKVVVPRGATVDYDDIRTTVGDIKDRTEPGPGPGAGHHFVLKGSAGLGDIKVMHPRTWRIGPFTVHRPFRITWGAGRTSQT